MIYYNICTVFFLRQGLYSLCKWLSWSPTDKIKWNMRKETLMKCNQAAKSKHDAILCDNYTCLILKRSITYLVCRTFVHFLLLLFFHYFCPFFFQLSHIQHVRSKCYNDVYFFDISTCVQWTDWFCFTEGQWTSPLEVGMQPNNFNR